MVVSSAFQHAIRDLMRDPGWDVPASTQRLAAAADSLPVGFDLCNDMFIRPDGTVGSCGADADSVGFAEPNAARLISAMLFGSARIPRLASLVPSPPLDATDCTQCNGFGKHAFAKNSHCDMCGGVGWVPDQYLF